MDATVPRPRAALPVVRAVLAWAGVAVLPLLWVYASQVATSGDGLGFGDWWIPLRYTVPALVVALPAALLPRRPLTALGLMLAGATLASGTVHGGDPGYLNDVFHLQFLAVDVAVGVLAATRPRRLSAPTAGVVLVVQVAASFLNSAENPISRATLSVLAVATAWTVGNSVRARRRYADALRSHAAVEAVTAERLRIARELHDLVAHSIGVIAIQAGVGARVIDTQPVQARNALATIEATSRDTLAGLRRTLGALRRPESESAPLDPLPGLDDLDRLVAAGADAGVRVEVRRRGQPRPVPADVDLAAYRIVQEALTNVVRHAGTHACQVTVEHRPDEVAVEVVDDGRGGPVGGAGHGIVGMRERVALLGGQFRAGPRPEGGFRVAARLPVPGVDR
ncbi:histidine kinase [Micromonospora phytophila]|uniref:sensor histidine kinase n=1 Tax=Micromonospora phytophila TaxID=709888 RepID=UPI002030A9F2|nr:histidine kinase [Micromonospora phytophila]MCM0676405.1 histidine kinase [Micromonospora phytophila]